MAPASSTLAPVATPGVLPPTPVPSTYVPIPRRALDDLRDSPRALGVYALLGRLYQITHTAIPLSPNDLQAVDPTLSYGAARRALERLVHAGYAVQTPADGRKNAYLPCWGRVHDQAIPWDRAVGSLGRPRHIAALRLDDRLLDTAIGSLRPHPTHPALLRRYQERPWLSLHDLGVYALALGGLRPRPTTTLRDLGLIDSHGRPAPVTPALEQLMREHRADAAEEDPSAPGDHAAPMDVIDHMIGHVIGHVIGSTAPTTRTTTAAECVISPSPPAINGSDGINGSDRIIQPQPSGLSSRGVDGGKIHAAPTTSTDSMSASRGAEEPGDTALPASSSDQHHAPSASEQLLWAIGVRRSVARTLADRPEAQISRVIAQARANPAVRDIAAWVVSTLRDLPATPDTAPPPKVSDAPILFHRGISGYQRSVWLRRFRAADPADRPAILTRFFAEHPLEEPHDQLA